MAKKDIPAVPAVPALEDDFGVTLEPIGKRILFRKDEDKSVTKGGIVLPDQIKIPQISGRIVAVSTQIENNPDYPLKRYDRVIVSGQHAVPVEFDPDNKLFVIPVEDVIAVFRRDEKQKQ